MPKLSLQKGERLISEIQANPVLYDSTHKDYSDLALKTKVWSSVAAKCGMRTANEAKSMWKNLRDCYRISRSKLNVNPNTRLWRFYNQMDFLAPYIKYRKSVFENSSSLEKDNSPPREMDLDIADAGQRFTTVYYWNDEEKNKDSTPTNEVEKPVVDEEQETRLMESRLQSPFDTDSYTETLEDGLPEVDGENSLKMFFDAMYASASNLPVSLQRVVKKKIFTAVLDAEEEAELLHDPPQPGLRIKLEP